MSWGDEADKYVRVCITFFPKKKALLIDLFNLGGLFSHCRPRDTLWKKYFYTLNYAFILTRLFKSLKARILKTIAPCKRSQHCWPTRCTIVGLNMLRAFAHHVVCCCVLLRLVGSCWMKFETGQTSSNNFQQVATTRNNTQHGVQTLATCWAQECCERLHGAQLSSRGLQWENKPPKLKRSIKLAN